MSVNKPFGKIADEQIRNEKKNQERKKRYPPIVNEKKSWPTLPVMK